MLITITGYITMFRKYSIMDDYGIVNSVIEEDLQGIPITEEVFNKNGWRKNREGVYFNADNTVCIGTNQLKNMKYAHQLQHILFALDLPTELLLP